MLKILVKKQMTEIFRSYFYDAKKNKARSKKATVLYMLWFVLLVGGILGGMFTILSRTLCAPLAGAGMGWLYFALMGLMAVLLGAFGSVFTTYSVLYLAKDNDLLLSLPIPVSVLMASRLLTVYLMGLLYSGVVILPAVIVYWVEAEVSPAAVLGGLLLILLISVFVMTISCALGYLVAKISLKLKNKSLITVVVSLAFFVVYYLVVLKAQTLISDLLTNALSYGETIRDAAYPVYLFGRVGVGDPAACGIVSLVVAALFALMWALISRSFLKLATSTGKSERRVYRETAVKEKSVFSALLGKELSRFLSSPNYMLNCGLGVLFLPVVGIAFLWKGDVIVSVLEEVFAQRPGTAMVLLCAAICMAASMNDMAAPSVSLEGKSLWLMQSLPVTPWQALKAKLSLQLLLTGAPMLLCILCMAFVCLRSPLWLAVAGLQLLSFVWFSALLCLVLGLKMPNLNWTSEITAIKQNLGVLIALFSDFLYAALLCVGFMLLGGWRLGFAGYMGVFGAGTLVLCAVLTLWLKKKGSALFAAL